MNYLNKQWQLDTNPFSWFRVEKEDGATEMVYASGKVYRYDERWEFRKVGLLQWLNPQYIKEGQYFSAGIPKVKAYRELQQKWASEEGQAALWKKYLDPKLQP